MLNYIYNSVCVCGLCGCVSMCVSLYTFNVCIQNKEGSMSYYYFKGTQKTLMLTKLLHFRNAVMTFLKKIILKEYLMRFPHGGTH
jgi:hypothetical protein